MSIVEFDLDTARFRATFDVDRDLPSLAVVAMISVAADSDPLDLAPLQSAIDPSALDAMFSTSADGVRRRGSVSFRYEGFEVTVRARGTIEATPVEAA